MDIPCLSPKNGSKAVVVGFLFLCRIFFSFGDGRVGTQSFTFFDGNSPLRHPKEVLYFIRFLMEYFLNGSIFKALAHKLNVLKDQFLQGNVSLRNILGI